MSTARERGLAKKAANEMAKAQKAQEDQERAEAAAWSVGAKDSRKAREEEEKEAEKRKKAAEKAALEAQEEAELSGVKRIAKPAKKKGKDDLAFLNAALANQPKTKAQKEKEEKEKLAAERKRQEEVARAAREEREKKEEEERKRNLARGIVTDHAERLMVPINNRLEEDDFEHARGLEAALDVLSVSGSAKEDRFPEKRQKALYKAFYERMLPIMREEQPHLKLTQYQDRIFQLWKTSPENPMSGK